MFRDCGSSRQPRTHLRKRPGQQVFGGGGIGAFHVDAQLRRVAGGADVQNAPARQMQAQPVGQIEPPLRFAEAREEIGTGGGIGAQGGNEGAAGAGGHLLQAGRPG